MSSPTSDSDDLEALFDSIVMGNAADEQPSLASTAEASDTTSAAPGVAEPFYSQLGHLTRKLHDTMRELGYDKALEKAADSIPDARQRLVYIATLTEQAAERALNATETAKPLQDKLEAGATALAQKWDSLFDNQLDVDDFKQLAAQTRDYLRDVPKHTQATNAQLMEIMMAQDFQDLTGQVIKKVIDLAQDMETQLLQMLVESTSAEKKAEVESSLLNGPVINADGRSDVVTSQEQVDDLLESLGF